MGITNSPHTSPPGNSPPRPSRHRSTHLGTAALIASVVILLVACNHRHFATTKTSTSTATSTSTTLDKEQTYRSFLLNRLRTAPDEQSMIQASFTRWLSPQELAQILSSSGCPHPSQLKLLLPNVHEGMRDGVKLLPTESIADLPAAIMRRAAELSRLDPSVVADYSYASSNLATEVRIGALRTTCSRSTALAWWLANPDAIRFVQLMKENSLDRYQAAFEPGEEIQ
jgi:hypothetical protein